MKITRSGYYRLLRADGTQVSQHNYEEEAFERAQNSGPGDYSIMPPIKKIVVEAVAAPPADPDPPVDPPADPDPQPDPQPPAGANPFNALYPASFKLPAMAADPIPAVMRPAKSTGLADAFIDPTYKTRVYRATLASEGTKGYMRHEYSRRQAFNADNSYFLARDENFNVYLYDANTFKQVRKLTGIGGNSEGLWHPTNPKLLRHYDGGLKWYEMNVDTGTRKLLFDGAGKLPWPGATMLWTKEEGTTSADGRYIFLMASNYNSAAQRNEMFGYVWLDLAEGKVLSTRSDSAFPDHCSTSPSGRWGVASGAQTVAWSRDFKESRVLLDRSEHSDLAAGPNGEDFYVCADYSHAEAIVAKNIDTGESFPIGEVYDRAASGSAAFHISGQAFGRPGWVLVTSYKDYSDYMAKYPSDHLMPLYRKASLLELKPNGRRLSVAHLHTDQASIMGTNYYWHEPHGTISRDGTRIMFASAFGAPGQPESYMVGLPDSVYG